jgi:hypothetical protein
MGIRRCFLAALCLPLISCTFLFSPEGESTGSDDDAGVDVDAAVECEGVRRTFDRGEPVDGDPNRFEYLDYAQGTITLWANALDTIEADVELVNLAGISIVVNADGTVTATLPSSDGDQSYTTADALVDWSAGEDVFFALRWDSKRPVSGDQGEGYHLMLQVDRDQKNGGVQGIFDPEPGSVTAMTVGDTSGLVHVDQVVVYGRPLYNDDSISVEDELQLMSLDKTDSAQLVEGGIDVSFATSAPIYAGCDAYKALAWSMPVDNLLPGQVRSGVSGVAWEAGTPQIVPPEELIYSSAIGVRSDSPLRIDLLLDAGGSYSVYALFHAQNQLGGAEPRLRMRALSGGVEVGSNFFDEYAANTSVDEPEAIFATFQMPDTLPAVRLELSNLQGGNSDLAIFHTLVIRENSFSNPSFEIPEGEQILDWQTRSDSGVARQGDGASDKVNMGRYSACFFGTGTRSDVTQVPGDLEQEEFYAAGAFVFRGTKDAVSTAEGAVTPGVTTGNSGFWGTGAPHEFGERVRAPLSSIRESGTAGVVAYRLRGPEYEATNDFIYFGGLGGQPSDVLDHCVDDAYFYPVTKIEGTFEAP